MSANYFVLKLPNCIQNGLKSSTYIVNNCNAHSIVLYKVCISLILDFLYCNVVKLYVHFLLFLAFEEVWCLVFEIHASVHHPR